MYSVVIRRPQRVSLVYGHFPMDIFPMDIFPMDISLYGRFPYSVEHFPPMSYSMQ